MVVEEALQIAMKRREVKGKGEKERWANYLITLTAGPSPLQAQSLAHGAMEGQSVLGA